MVLDCNWCAKLTRIKSFSPNTFSVRYSFVSQSLPKLVGDMFAHKRSSIAFNAHFHFAIKRGWEKCWFSRFFFCWFPVSFQLRNTSGYLPSKANFCGWNEKLTVIKWPIRKNYSITLSPNPFTPFLLRLREPSPKSQTAKKKKQFVNSESKFSWFHHILCFAYPLDTRSCSSLCFAVDICKLANVRLAPLVNVCSVFRILFKRHISRRTSNDLSWFFMAAHFYRTRKHI